jgi:hypothetical protein
MSQVAPTNSDIRDIRGKLTLAEVGVIASLMISVVTGGFTFGVLYGQVTENTKFRESSQLELKRQGEDIAAIKTSVQYLVDRDKEHRLRNF